MTDTPDSQQTEKLVRVIDSVKNTLSGLRKLGGNANAISSLGLAAVDAAAHELAAEVGKLSIGKPPGKITSANDDIADTEILLVEDNTVNRMVAEGMLQQMRCRIDVAENGQQAVERIRDSNYDIVFMDCQMPVMDGFEATARIREIESGSKRRRTPIVALTANALKGDRERCVSAGMDDYVSKPFTIADLKGAIDRQLGGEWTPNMRNPTIGSSHDTKDIELATPPAPELRNSSGAIELSVLDSIRGLQQTNGKELLARIIDVYLKSSPSLVENLHSSLKEGDPAKIAFSAHALRSSCASVGAVRLAACCELVEQKARQNEDVAWTEYAPTIEKRYRQATGELRLITSEQCA